MPDYSQERYNPSLPQCGLLVLEFNGKTLTMRGRSSVYTYHAVSGKQLPGGAFDYSALAQKKSNEGPIPEGAYWIRPDELWENAFWKPAPTAAWGNYRITIHPFVSTITHGRGGFFIHGGSTPGSAGCIDLWSDMDRFIKDMRAELGGNPGCQIHLWVRYE